VLRLVLDAVDDDLVNVRLRERRLVRRECFEQPVRAFQVAQFGNGEPALARLARLLPLGAVVGPFPA
jgi:hypothetical protein